MSACDKCQRSQECQQGKRCHIDTSLTDRAGMLVIILAGVAATSAVIIEIVTHIGK